MLFKTAQPSVSVLSRDEIEKNQNLGDLNVSPQPQEASSSAGNMVLDHVNEAALAAAFQEHIKPASSQPEEAEKPAQPTNLPTIEESEEARLERLGRQRPEVFESVWSEIGFVFSICMSQILTVCLSYPNISIQALINTGIFCFWVHCHSTHSCDGSSYPGCVVNMAS